MLRKEVGNTRDTNARKLPPNWEGPYGVTITWRIWMRDHSPGHGISQIYEDFITNFRRDYKLHTTIV